MFKFINNLKNKAKEEKGFTMMELAVVLVILAVLVAILYPQLGGFKDTANKSASNANLRTMQSAVTAYLSDPNNSLTTLAGSATGGTVDQNVLKNVYLIPAVDSNATFKVDKDGKVTKN